MLILTFRNILTSIFKQVSDFYKRPNVESPAKAALDDASNMFENRGVQMLGQIKHGSCRPRAILFKVLADTVGLESRLVVVRFCWWAQLFLHCVHLIASLLMSNIHTNL